MKKLLVPAAALALVGAVSGCGDEPSTAVGPDNAAGARLAPGGGTDDFSTYEITLENLTPATGEGSSQVFSPPVLATHNPSVRMFRVGRTASSELAQIAEDAVNQPMLDLLDGSRHVYATAQGGGAVPPGASATYEIRTAPGFPKLSMAFMLVNTNDAFSGVDALQLRDKATETLYLYAYDAGSEENTELMAHIPGPCCGNGLQRVPTNEPIAPHAGILGVGDLDPGTYGWTGPVARLTIRRLNPRYAVTVNNLTAPGAQVFSPPVLATHGPGARVFQVGDYASAALAALAEDGMTMPLHDALMAADDVHEVVVAPGAVPPGTSATYEIEAARGQRKLSMAFMLVNTNDAFSGLDGIVLPRGSATYELNTYDAGSEENTELVTHIPGPCCSGAGQRVPTNELIAPHDGILGVGDLSPDVYGWDDPSASVMITRTR